MHFVATTLKMARLVYNKILRENVEVSNNIIEALNAFSPAKQGSPS